MRWKERPITEADIGQTCYSARMRVLLTLYVAAMIALIVGLDVTLFRHRFWERLALNVGIVLIFAAIYLRSLRSS